MRQLPRRPIDKAAFRERYGPWAVIAGASEGTGECYARQLAAMGINLVLVSRRQEALEGLGRDLASEFGIEYRACTTLIDAANGFGKRFLKRGTGGIIVMASGAGLGGQPNLVMYAATKAFEINFAESLWAEYHERGIDVIGIAAPIMRTPTLLRIVPADFDTSHAFDPADVTNNALAGLLAGEPVQIIPDGPGAEKLPQVEADRRERLKGFIEFNKNFTGG